MDIFYSVMMYKGEGCGLDLTVLKGWESILEEISKYWALEASLVRVKYIIPDE